MSNTLNMLKIAEQDWPYPLALSSRSLRVKSRWEDAVQVACHVYEGLLRHVGALVLTEYAHLKYPSERLARYLMHRAYRGRLTCGTMIEMLREVAPYLKDYEDLLHMPVLIRALVPEAGFEAVHDQWLAPLNQQRIQWSHAKGHVAYVPIQHTDYTAFVDRLTQLMEQLKCLGDLELVYTQELSRGAQHWNQQVLLLQGAMQPFETRTLSLPLAQTPPQSQTVAVITEDQSLLPLYPFYVGRSDASGHCELAFLSLLRKKRAHWEPQWPAAPEGAAHNAYTHWMERFTLPEPEPSPTAAEASTQAPALSAAQTSSAAPHFRNATWRMFAMDWQLENTTLYNHAHYDALMQQEQVLAVWRYVPEENAYLLGVRPRMAALVSPESQAREVLAQCPVEYQADFSPEHGGHWHHSHYHWVYMPHQDALGHYLEQCDTCCRKRKGRL